jgi:hypothetical protein
LIAINDNTTLTVVAIEMKAAINANNECEQWKGKRRTAAQRKYIHDELRKRLPLLIILIITPRHR